MRFLRNSRRLLFVLIVASTNLIARLSFGTVISGESLFTYRYPLDDLGAIYGKEATTIKLWAPTAKTVKVLLFDEPAGQPRSTLAMSRSEEGIWSIRLDGDWDGRYYQFEIGLPTTTDAVRTVRVNDPYARGCSANSGRTLIYDAARTNPEGWDRDRFVPLKNNVDAVIYEVHIRDFTIHTNSGVLPNHRGRYLGMVAEGARTPDGQRSGIDHLKELGVTHVQILPAFDYAGGDERQKPGDYTWYNWGYNPLLFNTPEGSYATDADGVARQKEFKKMVLDYHRNHIGVIMDVVFNHTAATGYGSHSIFDKVFPGYYYRLDKNGRYANASACGNEIASERPMARKFIVDSIKYWMTEYHVDGFRFDLMGLLDRETMNEVYRAAKSINPSAILYGEGWEMERVLSPDKMATQANLRGSGIATFNDDIRDNIKGDNFRAGAAGLVQGAGPPFGGMPRFYLNIKGQTTGKKHQGIDVVSPNETINYDSAHDDLCLWDKLQLSAPGRPESVRANMDKLAFGILMTAQGVPFIHAGDEFLRSKNLNSNSYNDNGPQVNPIDWQLKTKHSDVFEFYRGMIALRKAHAAFRMSDRSLVDQSIEFGRNNAPGVVQFVIKNNANGDGWKNILVIYNCASAPANLTIGGDWQIVANDERAGTETLSVGRGLIHVAPYSLVVAHTDGEYHLDDPK